MTPLSRLSTHSNRPSQKVSGIFAPLILNQRSGQLIRDRILDETRVTGKVSDPSQVDNVLDPLLCEVPLLRRIVGLTPLPLWTQLSMVKAAGIHGTGSLSTMTIPPSTASVK